MGKDIKDIKKDILDRFRALEGEENDVLPEEWLLQEYLPLLNAHERKDFEKAIQQLAAKGFVKYDKNSGLKLQLTEKGANLIY
jgi:hypothetical protein